MSDRADLQVLVVASVPPPVAGQSVATTMLVDGLAAAGVRYRVVNLARPFRRARWQHLLARTFGVFGLFATALRHVGTLGVRNTVVYLQLGQGTLALVRDLPLLYLAAALRLPLVLHVHGGGFRRALETVPKVLRNAVAARVHAAARAIVLTESLRTQFEGLVAAERVVVIPNGVPKELERRARARRQTFTETGGRPFRVLFLSNLIPSKGYLTVLEAASLASESGADVEFVLAGAVTEETTTEPDDYIGRAGIRNVRYVGAVQGEAKLRLFEQADVFVLPTAYAVEGQPIVLLEAMHFGLPVVTCRVGGIGDFIVDGENGIFVQPGDPKGLLEAIHRLAQDPQLRRECRVRNLRAAARQFSAAAHGAAVLEVIASAGRGRTGSSRRVAP